MKKIIFCVVALAFLLGCGNMDTGQTAVKNKMTDNAKVENAAIATLAGGCFWCVGKRMGSNLYS